MNPVNLKEIEIDLLKFSPYKIYYGSFKNFTESDELKKEKPFLYTAQAMHKYIIIYIIYKNKIINQVTSTLNQLETVLEKLKNHYEQNNKIQIIIYKFDNKYKFRELKTTSKKINIKFFFTNLPLYWKVAATISTLFSSFFLFYSILGLSEYGIPVSKIPNIIEFSFILYFLVLGIVILFSITSAVVVFLMVPILIDFGFSGLLKYILIVIYFLVYFYLYMNTYENKNISGILHRFNIALSKFTASYFFILGTISLILFIPLQSLLSTLIMKPVLNDKSGYQLVKGIYTTLYSGYPKILKDINGVSYYVPIDDKKYYYVYNINETKKQFIADKNSTINKNVLCKYKNDLEKFQKNYILYNPYLKMPNLIEVISKDKEGIALEYFDESKMINLIDVEKICKKERT